MKMTGIKITLDNKYDLWYNKEKKDGEQNE